MKSARMPRKDRQEQRNQERDMGIIKRLGAVIVLALLLLSVAYAIRPR